MNAEEEPVISVQRILDLSVEADREELIRNNSSHPKADLFQHLDVHRRFFPNPALQTVYSGGFVSFHNRGYLITDLVEVAMALDSMSSFGGFDRLLAGFRNERQFHSTIYEAKIAHWCQTRRLSRRLEFSPLIQTSRGPKRPDFLWTTQRGQIYVECKQADTVESRSLKRTNSLLQTIQETYDSLTGWNDSLRLDLFISPAALNGVELRLRRVVLKLHQDQQADRSIRDGEVLGTLRRRDELPEPLEEVITSYRMVVGPEPTRLARENSHLSLALSVERSRQLTVARLVRDARKQLPDQGRGVGAVFVDMGREVAAGKKIQQLIGTPSYERTPLIGISVMQTPVQLHWRTGQPFDNDLFS